MVLYPGCPSFSQGTNIFPYFAEMILCASMQYKMLVIKGTIARSGAIFLSRITSYLAIKKEKEKKKKKNLLSYSFACFSQPCIARNKKEGEWLYFIPVDCTLFHKMTLKYLFFKKGK